MPRTSIIIVIAYNRPALLRELLSHLSTNCDERVLVSVDCDLDGEIDNDIKQMAFEKFRNLEWRFCAKKLGVSGHIPTLLNEVFKTYDNAIILEDDVRISPKVLLSGMKILETRLPERILTVGFFGSLGYRPYMRFIFGENKWRESEFFSAWGWAIQRESWGQYKRILDRGVLENELLNSDVWNKKSEKRKLVWLKRFQRVIENPDFTWDYQMQALTYSQNYNHLLPIYRSADNVGFNNFRATNTKNSKPFWYRFKRFEGTVLSQMLKPGLRQMCLHFLDRVTWGGDFNLNSIKRRLSFRRR
jgi:hypothetical protein